jgi:hypothetical protein
MNGTGWYEDGNLVWDKPGQIMALGAGDLAAVQYNVFEVVDLKAGQRIAVAAFGYRRPRALRSRGGGFHAVLDGAKFEDPLELWDVAADGTATKLGLYPPMPPNTSPGQGLSTKLAPDDSLFQTGSMTGSGFVDIIMRRKITGESTIVYTEADNPNVKIHISYLVTGS